jgi:Family of unknown function (DUF5995)
MLADDSALLQAIQAPAEDISGVLAIMRSLDAVLPDADGLKWFNWLYLQVTVAVAALVAAGGFHNPAWLTELDVQFARLYFEALRSWLSSGNTSKCWQALFERRSDTAVARIQFALAGINAHINHDLALAIDNTCKAAGTTPRQDSPEYADYTSVNGTLDSLIDTAKQTLMVRLLGDALPPVSHLEDLLGAWNIAAAREAAWTNSEVLWQLRGAPALYERWLEGLDGITSVAGKGLLVAVPMVQTAGL